MTELIQPWVKYKCVHCGKEICAYPDYNLPCQHQTKGKNPKTYTYPFDVHSPILENAPTKLKEIVSKTNYGELLINETGKRIIGEYKTRKVIIICLNGGRLVKNAKPTSYNQLATGLSGVGKDYTTENTLNILPKHFWYHKTRLSEKALSYWHPSDKEPNFTWNGKILYCEDVTNSFLNSDTVKVMMTGGSDIAIVDKGELKSIKINGSPEFICTSATAEPNKELNRRVTSAPLDFSEEQTSKILEFQSKVAAKGIPEYDKSLVDSAYLLTLVTVLTPFTSELLDSFPKTLQSRTNFDRLLDIIKANAALHQYSRERTKEGYVIANEIDLKEGLEIFEYLYPSRNTSLTHAQQKLVDYLKEIEVSKSAAEIFRETGFNFYAQMNKMIEGLRSLASKGFVNITEGDRNGKPTDLYEFIPELNINKVEVSKVSKVSIVNRVNKVSNNKNSTNTPTVVLTCINCNSTNVHEFKDMIFCFDCKHKEKKLKQNQVQP